MLKINKNLLNRRLIPLYATSFFQSMVFWYAIEKLFMKSIGFNDQTIALTTILFTVVMLCANIPMGILADRWSRKGVLVLASVALILCCLVAGFSHGFWLYTLAASFWGIFYACHAGTYDSIVYDTLIEQTGTADQFEHYYGRVHIADGVGLVLGSLLSSLATHYLGLRASYFLTIPFTCLSIVALLYFAEPKEHKKEVALVMGKHLKTTFRAIMKKGEVLWIVLTLICLTIGLRLMLEFDQLWLIALALPVAYFGPVNALLLTSIGSGGVIAGKIKNRASVLIIGFTLFFTCLILLTQYRTLLIFAQVILLTGFITLNILLNRSLHDTLASNIRVGASSVVTTLGYIAFLPIAFIFGVISKNVGVFRAAWVVVVVVAVTVFSLVMVSINRKPKTSLI